MILALVTGAIGISLISSGTYAYFSDEVETTNKIESGTLKLGLTEAEEDGVLFEFSDKKPGDIFDYTFELTNDGSLDIGEVTLISDYTVTGDGVKESVNDDFASQIRINSLIADGADLIPEGSEGITIDKLEDLTILTDFKPDTTKKVHVEFEFMRTDKKQNQFQGNAMDLNWTFEAMQVFDE